MDPKWGKLGTPESISLPQSAREADDRMEVDSSVVGGRFFSL
jgi:hypothetical protein